MIISIVNEKGGSGKSTLLYNLAITHSLKTLQKPIVIDSDPQKSIASFIAIRNEENKEKLFNFTYKFADELKAYLAKVPKKECVIIDTGGRDSKEMRIAIAMSDIVIIPTTASQFDLCVLDKMINIVKMAKQANSKLKAYIVINRASTNPFLNKRLESLKEYINMLENDYIKLCENIIYEREAYKNATSMGISVIEMNKLKNKAKDEIESLYKEIIESEAKGIKNAI